MRPFFEQLPLDAETTKPGQRPLSQGTEPGSVPLVLTRTYITEAPLLGAGPPLYLQITLNMNVATLTRSRWILFGSVSLVLSGDLVRAQEVLFTQSGTEAEERFGSSVTGLDDLNSDGVPDWAVGAEHNETNGIDSGAVFVYSGSDGALLLSVFGEDPDDRFGRAVCNMGDVDGDGVGDFGVGAVTDSVPIFLAGSASVISGASGQRLFTVSGDAQFDGLGWSVTSIEDQDGDGARELIVGAPLNDGSSIGNQGLVRMYSGATGVTLETWRGTEAGDWFGFSLDNAGDVDGDGAEDLIVGSFFGPDVINSAGRATVISGATRDVLLILDGSASQEAFGGSVSGAGDVNGDGFDDILVGIARFGSDNRGRAQVFLGPTGQLLYTLNNSVSNAEFGRMVQDIDDIDGDGIGDLMVGAPLDSQLANEAGSARAFSGATGDELFILHGEDEEDQFGTAIAAIADVSADGFGDFIITAKQAAPGAISQIGTASLYRSTTEIGTRYCGPAVPNSAGTSGIIEAFGSTVVDENRAFLRASSLAFDQFGFFINGTAQGLVVQPGTSQGTLCVVGSLGRHLTGIFNSGPAGTGRINLDLERLPSPAGLVAVQAGETRYFTCWHRDANPGPTSNFTDAVALTFD